MSNKKPGTFVKGLHNFLESLINQRKYLLLGGKSGANTTEITDIVKELNQYLEAYKFSNDLKIASFFMRNEERFYKIIPQNNSYAGTLARFSSYKTVCRDILKN